MPLSCRAQCFMIETTRDHVSFMDFSSGDGHDFHIYPVHAPRHAFRAAWKMKSWAAKAAEQKKKKSSNQFQSLTLNFISQVAEKLNINWIEFRCSAIKTFKFLFSAQLFNHLRAGKLLCIASAAFDWFTFLLADRARWCNHKLLLLETKLTFIFRQLRC